MASFAKGSFVPPGGMITALCVAPIYLKVIIGCDLKRFEFGN